MSKQKKVIQALQRAVAALPHLRVGQIINNARLTAGIKADMFYVTDEQLAEALDSYRLAAR